MSLALVTGASSGIGLSLAGMLAERKSDLVITARSQAALKKIAADLKSRHGVSVTVLPCDLGVAEGPRALAESLAGKGLEPDILVNNAGFGTYGPFLEQTGESQAQMIQVNVT